MDTIKKVHQRTEKLIENNDMTCENSFSTLEEDKDNKGDVLENGSGRNAGLKEDDLGQDRDRLKTRGQLHNKISRLKNTMSLNDKLHENEALDLHHKAKYCKGESTTQKEIDEVNKYKIANLCNRRRLSNCHADCVVYLMRGELGSRKDIIVKLERKI